MTSRGKLIINRNSLHEDVARHLREMIVSGELKPGAKIPVAELSERLDVSLTPLREAMKVLAEEQLIELTPNRGGRVVPVTVEGTRSLFEVMAGLEAMAAELAAERMTDDQLATLEVMHAEMRRCLEVDEKEGYFALNRKIHDAIVDCVANPILTNLRSKLAVRAEQIRYISVQGGARRRQALQDHEDLMEALRRRDASSAYSVWRRHLIGAGEEACEVLSASNLAG
jgi:DNA-binding GntR family transcriptional regulator